ncbi:MAG TPA: OsmC family protein [Candidatus Bathyarchaeia archaeon]|nr:OsmC family protein [Candidatus Bathyarchaeia archaeon]
MQETQQKLLNGLEVPKLDQFVQDLKTKPDVAKAVNGPWRSRVEWQGGLKARGYMRNHVASFDEPEGLGATDTAASAHEHILSAVGACMMTGFVFQATRKGIKIHNCEIALEGTFGSILNWAGLSDEDTPGYPEIKAKMFVKADASPEALEKIWNEAWKRSVVTQTVAREVKITPSFEAV